MLCRKGHAFGRLACRNNLYFFGAGRQFAVVHGEMLALKIGRSLFPQISHHLHVFAAVGIAVAEVFIAGPDIHLGVFVFGPAGHNVNTKPARRDAIYGTGHASHNRRR